MTFTFIDLFAGIGGFRSALTALGGVHLYTNEYDVKAGETYKAWYGADHFDNRDIRSVEPECLPDNIDFLAAGFPCQPFSIAGVSKKNSLNRPHGFEDEKQGNLFFALEKIIETKRPRVFLLENVKNLKSHDSGNTWSVIESRLRSHNYVLSSQVLSAKSIVPQNRERIFIVGFDRFYFPENEVGQHFKFPDLANRPAVTLDTILETNPDKKYMLTPNLWKYLQGYKMKHAAKGNGFGYQTFGPKQTARTISARYYKDGADVLIEMPNWEAPRKLTPNEAKLLMGFTNKYASLFNHQDGFPQVVSDSQSYKQFGNAVVPGLVELIVANMLEAIEKIGGFQRPNT